VHEARPTLMSAHPGCRGASREQSREHWAPVSSGRGRLRRSGPPRPGTGLAGRARQGRSLPATYDVRGAFGVPWANDSANLVTHSLQMKISVSLAKLWGSLTGYSAPKSVCTCWWDFLQTSI
jgi:hypothetical protein